MKIINQIEKKSMAEKEKAWRVLNDEVSVLQRRDTTMGGILILSRVLGHPEFEPVLEPLFS